MDDALPQSAVDQILADYGLTRDDMVVKGLSVKDGDSWVRLNANLAPLAERVNIDPAEVLNRLEHPTFFPRHGGESAFVISLNDWQTGKLEGGGTPALIERIHASVAKAKCRIEELRAIGRDLGRLVIIGGGDLIEGCNIYPNQNNELDLLPSEQIETALTLILYVIKELAPLFEQTTILATKGNHGENRVNGYKLAARDNNDTMLFRLAKQATDMSADYAHVEYVICEPELEYAHTEVCGWTLGTTHGDIFGKFVQGQTKMLKAWNWFKNMAVGKQRVVFDVLITHHFHHEEKADWGTCVWAQTRAQDGGSAYFEQYSGQYSEPGMLSFVMTPAERYQDEAYL